LNRWLRPSNVVVCLGAALLLVGGIWTLGPILLAAGWQRSPLAARAQRNAEAPTPVWVTPTTSVRSATQPTDMSAPQMPTSVVVPRTPAPTRPMATSFVAIPEPTVEATPTAPPATPDLQLISSRFEFLDPPEPGAAARLSVVVRNPMDDPSGQITLQLSAAWLSGYRIESTDPPLVNGDQSKQVVSLAFPGAPAQAEAELTIEFVTVDEVIDPPVVAVLDGLGRQFGQARPATEAPPARPGPIYSLEIPRLHLQTAVVPVDWEPPLFVVGQLRTSAWVTRGNSVLVGHVRGAAGYNVFDHLDELEPGDRIIASSRGQTYNFTVSLKQVLPEADVSPTRPSFTPRLTLMTCTGDWDPLAQDYPDRLWVYADPA
jgi:hypothetical protein